MITGPLKGLRVLNTRPLEQGKALNQAIQQAGGEVICCPTLEIQALPPHWVAQLEPLTAYKAAIFISTNAVDYFFQGLEKNGLRWPETLPALAIGKATAEVLRTKGLQTVLTPDYPDSEHLLKLELLTQVNNQKILLVKGLGGRDLIETTLAERQALLNIIEVYQRSLPQIQPEILRTIWQNDAVDIILLTSAEALNNLWAMTGEKAHPWLKKKPCMVVSQRIGLIAQAKGIETIILSHPETLLADLINYNKGSFHGKQETNRQ